MLKSTFLPLISGIVCLQMYAADKINDIAPNIEGIEIFQIPENLKTTQDKINQNVAKDGKVNFEYNKVYVLEFWASWCGPCIRVFPHLSQLQQKYGDQLIVIGVSIDGNQQAAINKAKEQEKNMQYRVALDKKGQAQKEFFTAFKQRGIPCAFIIGKDRKIAWVGHPAGMDAALQKAIEAPNCDPSAQPKIEEKPETNTTEVAPIIPEMDRVLDLSLPNEELNAFFLSLSKETQNDLENARNVIMNYLISLPEVIQNPSLRKTKWEDLVNKKKISEILQTAKNIERQAKEKSQETLKMIVDLDPANPNPWLEENVSKLNPMLQRDFIISLTSIYNKIKDKENLDEVKDSEKINLLLFQSIKGKTVAEVIEMGK